jgi:hypothetical protein
MAIGAVRSIFKKYCRVRVVSKQTSINTKDTTFSFAESCALENEIKSSALLVSGPRNGVAEVAVA